ncbi:MULTISPECIES: CDP-diacylglycerol--glycerol-3-phosphate 3-phosphatidyltransferase [unclassified Mycoplasma]|uniref:CDP-diacylglycerol--glycerol-3-phosphate 3-phosphatidyltransferase n=1 Tax=unclassified Mycoplasma TaxID=2683645 RepID=UPI000FDD6052
MNLPNKLTVFRLILVLPLIVLFSLALSLPSEKATYQLQMTYMYSAGGVFALAMITDWLDGWIARRRQEVTTFGKVFDPIADKLVVVVSLIFLALLKVTPFFVPILVVMRDICVDGTRILKAHRRGQVAANMLGKMKTVLQSVGILVVVFVAPILNWGSGNQFEFIKASWQLWMINATLLVSLLLAYVSGFWYIHQNLKTSKVTPMEHENA